MSNSVRSIIFVIAFMLTMTFFIFIFPNLYWFFLNDLSFFNGIALLLLVMFPLIQCISRYIYTKKYYVADKKFFVTPIKPQLLYQRALFYTFLVLVIAYPIYKYAGIEGFKSMEVLLSFCVWIAVIEGLMLATSKLTKAYFMIDTIIIRGLDMRMDLPLSDALRTHSGIYAYGDFAYYTLKDNVMSLYLQDDAGIVKVILPENKLAHITAFLGSRGIRRENKIK